jgi:hypothetical protein
MAAAVAAGGSGTLAGGAGAWSSLRLWAALTLTPRCRAPQVEGGRQTVLVSATLSRTVLAKSARWCPDPEFVGVGVAPVVQKDAGERGGDSKDAGPGWGWGAKGWEGPANERGPKTEGAAGGLPLAGACRAHGLGARR